MAIRVTDHCIQIRTSGRCNQLISHFTPDRIDRIPWQISRIFLFVRVKGCAYKNGHIVYLAHPNVWYTAEGGIQALSEMLSDLENALL